MVQIITKDDILKLANLARLELSDAEVEHFTVEIEQILEYVHQLETFDEVIEPTYQLSGNRNVFRPDQVADYDYSLTELMQNFSDLVDGQIPVKRMI